MKLPLQKIADPAIVASGVNLFVLRLDMIHPHISGNKFFKLKYNLEEAKKQNKGTLLTFGGAYSNHIAATAAAGKEHGFKTIGIIRGEELHPAPVLTFGRNLRLSKGEGKFDVNPTLNFAIKCGMHLHFISREKYRKKESEEFIQSLQKEFGAFYLLPEGGTNELAVKGCAEIVSFIDIPFNHVCCPVGTGGTLAGIISSLKEGQKAIGFSVLKGVDFASTSKVSKTLEVLDGRLNHDYHFGGYAKHTSQLLRFIEDFEKQNNIPLEQVYTGKMMFGIYDLIQKGRLKRHETVIAIHTGGLQGKLH